MAETVFRKSEIYKSNGIILPGGMPGARNLLIHEGLRKALLYHHDCKNLIAAICAAPMVLGKHGILKQRRATCYPGFEQELEGAELVNDWWLKMDISSQQKVQELLQSLPLPLPLAL